ncbi:MAG: CO dehydrogenase/acetyl-CoA synthase complex subunit epsilon [Candidatus Hydrothermarchaeaceae archaeon]
MVTKSTSWQFSNAPGPKSGMAVKPDVAARIIDKAENPMLVVGAGITELDDALVDAALRLAKAGITLAPTSHSLKLFKEHGIEAAALSMTELTNMLRDEEWQGLRGDGRPDLVLFLGIEYWLLSQMANTLKNFTEIETINLTKYYQPNTTYSFPNLTDALWLEYLDGVYEKLVDR